MKPTRTCLWLLALACAGCLTGPETHSIKPPAAELAEPPPRVQPEEVNASNLRASVHKLKAEIDYAERDLHHERKQ